MIFTTRVRTVNMIGLVEGLEIRMTQVQLMGKVTRKPVASIVPER